MGKCFSRPKQQSCKANEEPEENKDNKESEYNEEPGESEESKEPEECEKSEPEVDELKKINEFLFTLYEKELKFKRPDAEVKDITSAVETIVEKLMTAVGNEDPQLEISKQYIVGSMAEGTSIMEPDEYDFLVVLKSCSNLSHIYLPQLNGTQILVYKNGQPLCLDNLVMKLSEVILPLYLNESVTSDYGTLSFKSTTVCHHGPANVIKLLWEPLSNNSEPLDILVDITPCIEQQGIDTVIQASDVDIPAHYEALVRDDKYMLIPRDDEFVSSFTTTEVKIVRTLSVHHKMCYMILKYCLNGIILENSRNEYQSPFSSYIIKTFVLQHAVRCKNITTSNTEMSDSLYTCLVDIFLDIQRNARDYEILVDGIFDKIYSLLSLFSERIIRLHIENIIQILVQIRKQGNTTSNDLQFTHTCYRDSIHPIVRYRAETLAQNQIECHLSHTCEIHSNYDIKKIKDLSR